MVPPGVREARRLGDGGGCKDDVEALRRLWAVMSASVLAGETGEDFEGRGTAG